MDIHYTDGDEAESFLDFAFRVYYFMTITLEDLPDNTYVFTHGGFIKLFMLLKEREKRFEKPENGSSFRSIPFYCDEDLMRDFKHNPLKIENTEIIHIEHPFNLNSMDEDPWRPWCGGCYQPETKRETLVRYAYAQKHARDIDCYKKTTDVKQ